MTREEALLKLTACVEKTTCADGPASDIRDGHEEADEVLCAVLSSLGYGTVVEMWGEVMKWYS
jgi:hypothetical protein